MKIAKVFIGEDFMLYSKKRAVLLTIPLEIAKVTSSPKSQ